MTSYCVEFDIFFVSYYMVSIFFLFFFYYCLCLEYMVNIF